jgi:anti-sigma factor RsiW
MTCDDKIALINALVDRELDVVHAREIENHMAGCAECTRRYDDLMNLRRGFADPALRVTAPDHLRAAIVRAAAPPPGAAAAQPLPQSQSRPWRLRLQGAFAGAATSMALAAALALFVFHADMTDELTRGLVDGHLRSLSGQHLYDVQSTDQHTVKPWFAGRLEVTPPVPDLSLQGFTLVGGRIDYVGGRAVAVVVYRRRTHVINLFVWKGDGEGPAAADRGGYFLRHWTADNLAYWAVSDLNAAELGDFETAYRAQS